MRVKFNKVLNKEPKIYNVSYFALGLGAICGILGVGFYGFVGFFGGCTGGFLVGKKIGEAWWSGRIQRYLYWNLPKIFTAPIIGGKFVPPSHVRRLF